MQDPHFHLAVCLANDVARPTFWESRAPVASCLDLWVHLHWWFGGV